MKKPLIWAALIVLTLVTAGCGNSKSSGNTGDAAKADNTVAASGTEASVNDASKEKPAAVKKIIVGTGTKFPKVCFIDENGKLTGFDVELVKEIDKRLPDYEFE